MDTQDKVCFICGEPAVENIQDTDFCYQHARFAEKFLGIDG